MLRAGKEAGMNIGGIVLNRRFDGSGRLRIAFDEFWPKFLEQADNVVDHQDLTVTGGRGADANCWDAEPGGDLARQWFDGLLYHHAERSGPGDGLSIGQDCRRL